MRHGTERAGASTKAVVWTIVVVGLLACVGAWLAGRAVLGPTFAAIDEGRVSANRLKSNTIAMQLAMAQTIAQREFEGEAPTIPFLVQQNFITEEVLESPFGPVDDGGRDYWLHPAPPAPPAPDTAEEPGRLVLAYDRAMYRHHDLVSVAYLNGRSDLLTIADFDALIAAPPNGGVDYELPPRP